MANGVSAWLAGAEPRLTGSGGTNSLRYRRLFE
jgi:hypothetical protein